MAYQVTDSVQGNILIVDDTPANLRLLSNMLSEQGFKVRSVINGPMALTAIRAAPPDLVLLDINMPGMNGYEVCDQLKADPATREIPIIFISALDEVHDKVKAFTVGGVDYITKPFQFEEVLARVKTHLALRNLQRELMAEIAERDRLIAELDAYAHTVAHDLKNPLTALVGFSSLLLKRFRRLTDEEIEQNLAMIAQNARKMTNIIDELLLLSSVRKVDEVACEPLDMARIVAEAKSRLVDMVAESNALIEEPETWPVALGHAAWVEEVWANYLSNAIKYGGTPPHIRLGGEVGPNGQARFWVQDNGPGLTAEECARLFTPFERLGQVRAKGHGLGLSIVQRIVQKLGGKIGVESAPGAGSRFYFTLPLAQEEKHDATTAEA